MSVIGIGVDLIECARIQHSIDRFGDRFLHRVFTDSEIEYSMSMKFPERHLAARFAAKEAVAKAFGTGIGRAMGWRNIDIRKKESGEPFLVFSGPAQELAARRGVITPSITQWRPSSWRERSRSRISLGVRVIADDATGSLSETNFHPHDACHHSFRRRRHYPDPRTGARRGRAQVARSNSCGTSTGRFEELYVQALWQRERRWIPDVRESDRAT